MCDWVGAPAVDTVDAAEVERLRGLMRKMNPDAKVLSSSFCDIPLEEVLNTRSYSLTKASLMPGWMKIIREVWYWLER